VNIKVQNKTALQLAAHEGYQSIVTLLLDAGADAKIQDEDGDSAYHYAAFGFVLWAYYNCDTSTIRVRFDYDSTTIRLQHATTRYEAFRALAYEIVYENQW